MNEIKIKVSIKVWIYCILMLVALYAILLGVSYHFSGTSNHWISIVTMIGAMLAFNLIPRRFVQNTRLVIHRDRAAHIGFLGHQSVDASGIDIGGHKGIRTEAVLHQFPLAHQHIGGAAHIIGRKIPAVTAQYRPG